VYLFQGEKMNKKKTEVSEKKREKIHFLHSQRARLSVCEKFSFFALPPNRLCLRCVEKEQQKTEETTDRDKISSTPTHIKTHTFFLIGRTKCKREKRERLSLFLFSSHHHTTGCARYAVEYKALSLFLPTL
jgi:hypothetical protein